MNPSEITILFVYPTPFNPKTGGVERVTDTLTRDFIRLGYRVIYLHHRPDIKVSEYNYPAPVYFFPSTDYHAPENYAFYHDFLKRHHIDIVINQSGNFADSKLYLSVGNNTSIKTISVLHSNPLLNYDYLPEEVLKLRSHSFLEYLKLIGRFLIYPKIKSDYWKRRKEHFAFLFNHTDIVCLLSENYTQEIRRIYSGKTDKITAIANPNTYSETTLPSHKEKIVLYVGRLSKGQKRPDRLLKIWKKIYKNFPDWKLVFVGDGTERKCMEKMAASLKNVYFEGFQEPETFYKKAALFALTSNFEGFPMVLTEALQLGVTTVAFDSFAAITDVIHSNENGFLIQPFDLDAYTAKLKLLMSDDNLRMQMAKNGFSSVRKFDREEIVNQWKNLFNRLLYNG